MPINQTAQPAQPGRLNSETLALGLEFLSNVDRDLARISRELGSPPLWACEPGFPTLVYIILEQQVSSASAKAAFDRLQEATLSVTPDAFLKLDDEELRRIGFSRQKTSYCRGLAAAIRNGEIDLGALDAMDDASARSALVKIKGIGPWTADNYLLMAMLRPDIWPSGDLALVIAVQELKQLPARPDREEMDRIAVPWHPWRSVAAWLLWHYYLGTRSTAG